jgi:hypothetical protein
VIPPYLPANGRAIGANVTVSGSEVPRAIHASTVSVDQILPAAVHPVSAAIEISPAGALPAEATLTFKLDTQLNQNDAAFIETSDSASGPWSLVSPTVSKDGWHASVQTKHLSFWRAMRVDPNALASLLHRFLDPLSGDLFTTAGPPKCGNDIYQESQAQRDGYSITSSARKTLYWCFGQEGNQRILKIVNRMRYPIQVSHPGFTFIRDSGPLVSLDLEQMARLGSGPDTILFPFEEADYAVNLSAGGTASIRTDFANLAESLGLFENIVTVVLSVAAVLEKVVVTTTELTVTIVEDGERITIALNETTRTVETENGVAHIVTSLLDKKDCAAAVLSHDLASMVRSCLDASTVVGVLAAAIFVFATPVGAAAALALATLVVGPWAHGRVRAQFR